jgi:hypothetical protein
MILDKMEARICGDCLHYFQPRASDEQLEVLLPLKRKLLAYATSPDEPFEVFPGNAPEQAEGSSETDEPLAPVIPIRPQEATDEPSTTEA